MKSMWFVVCAILVANLAWGFEYKRDLYGNATEGFSPNPQYSRTKSLGTKGFYNYSTTGKIAVRFKSLVNSTATAVKVFFNGDETAIFPSADDTVFIHAGATKIGFRAYSTVNSVVLHVLGQ